MLLFDLITLPKLLQNVLLLLRRATRTCFEEIFMNLKRELCLRYIHILEFFHWHFFL